MSKASSKFLNAMGFKPAVARTPGICIGNSGTVNKTR